MGKKIVAVVILVSLLVLPLLGCVNGSDSHPLRIDAENRGAVINQDMYGIFLEDISYAIDGGLVNNLFANGSFEYPDNPLYGWRVEGAAKVIGDDPLNDRNPSYLSLTPIPDTITSLSALGFVEYYEDLGGRVDEARRSTPDIGVKAGHTYRLSFYARNRGFEGNATVRVGTQPPLPLPLPAPEEGWKKISLSLPVTETADVSVVLNFLPASDPSLGITSDGSAILSPSLGSLDLDMLELADESGYGFGSEEWKYVSLRSDLVQAIADLNPGFIRFPGGCFLEGRSLAESYQWKDTIGPLENRVQSPNYWREEADGREYQNTNAMGFHEYLQLSEDLGALPFPIFHAGFACQGYNHYHTMEKKYRKGKLSESEWQAYLDSYALRPDTPEFDAYVQDILDFVEYATGDVSTTWGALRAENGHPDPFDLQYLGIGNENWGELYWRNFTPIYDALKAKYPALNIISSAGSAFSGERKETAWEKINADYRDTVVDEHYYTENYKLFTHNDYYDDYDRSGAKVFLGEFSAMCPLFGKVITKNNLWSTIEEASFMTGLERNGDVVQFVSYAPTFAKNNAHCWTNNLIWFDSQRITLTPTYYNFLLNANNVGTQVLNTEFNRSGCYTVSEIDEENQVIYVKLVNAGKRGFDFHIELSGVEARGASLLYLSDESRAAANTIGKTTVLPDERSGSVDGTRVSVRIDGLSVNVLRIPYGENDGNGLWKLPDLPQTMEATRTSYDTPYLTMEALTLICIFVGGPLLAAALACLWIFLLRPRLKPRLDALKAKRKNR